MIWRLARWGSDGVLAPESLENFQDGESRSTTSDGSLLARLRQHLCSDESLAEQLKSGNADALAILFKRHGPLLFGIARRVLRNDAEAEDTVQQVFLDVFRSIHQFESEKGTFKAWLLLFAYHRSFNSRRSQIANRFFETDQLDDCVAALQQPAAGQSNTENSILAGQVLKTLEPRQRRTIELTYYEGLTADEVSIRTGESVRVVRHNLYRGLDKLRAAFHTQPICSKQREQTK